MGNQLQMSLQRLHVSLNHSETRSKCFSSRIFELRSSSMQSYHRLVKRIPWRSRKQERKFNAEFNNDNEILSTIASTEMIGILQPADNVISEIWVTRKWITEKVMFCWHTREARDLARDLDRFSSLSRVTVAIPPQSVFRVTSFLFCFVREGRFRKITSSRFLATASNEGYVFAFFNRK